MQTRKWLHGINISTDFKAENFQCNAMTGAEHAVNILCTLMKIYENEKGFFALWFQFQFKSTSLAPLNRQFTRSFSLSLCLFLCLSVVSCSHSYVRIRHFNEHTHTSRIKCSRLALTSSVPVPLLALMAHPNNKYLKENEKKKKSHHYCQSVVFLWSKLKLILLYEMTKTLSTRWKYYAFR